MFGTTPFRSPLALLMKPYIPQNLPSSSSRVKCRRLPMTRCQMTITMPYYFKTILAPTKIQPPFKISVDTLKCYLSSHELHHINCYTATCSVCGVPLAATRDPIFISTLEGSRFRHPSTSLNTCNKMQAIGCF